MPPLVESEQWKEGTNSKPDETSLMFAWHLLYFFLNDDAFPLRTMNDEAILQDGPNHDERIFMYKISQIRQVVKNAFINFTSRFISRNIDEMTVVQASEMEI